MWSKCPWVKVDCLGDPALPPGRFVQAVTQADGHPVRVIGVCVPWAGAHVTTGRKDRRRWEEHQLYLGGLARVIRNLEPDHAVLAGDFNQTIPRTRAPKAAFASLMNVIGDRLQTATAGLEIDNKAAIDHVVLTADLGPTHVDVINPRGADVELSDHFGVAVDCRLENG